jgi:hypothetical protein
MVVIGGRQKGKKKTKKTMAFKTIIKFFLTKTLTNLMTSMNSNSSKA